MDSPFLPTVSSVLIKNINVMKTKAYENFNELVFEERNKFYGAYVLRKQYEDNLLISLFFGVVFIGSIATIPYLAKQFGSTTISEIIGDIPTTPPTMIFLDPPVDKPMPENDPSPKKSGGGAPSIQNLAPVITVDANSSVVTPEDLKGLNPGSTTDPGNGGLLEIGGEGPGTGTEKTIVDLNPGFTNFAVVEKKPMFPGGDEALYKYLSKNIHYPDRAKQMGITGIVYVQFIIDEFGGIQNVKAVRGIGGGCDEEAQRVIKGMPRWIPGKQGGHAVRVQYHIPIDFQLN